MAHSHYHETGEKATPSNSQQQKYIRRQRARVLQCTRVNVVNEYVCYNAHVCRLTNITAPAWLGWLAVSKVATSPDTLVEATPNRVCVWSRSRAAVTRQVDALVISDHRKQATVQHHPCPHISAAGHLTAQLA